MWDHLDRILDMLLSFSLICAAILPFIFRWLMRINSTYRFSKSMAENHLPHLYRGQRMIAKKLGIDLDDDPIINFSDSNGHK